MPYETLLITKDGPVAVITLNRPQALNALNKALTAELGRAFTELECDDEVRAIILTGSERAFAAGADVKEMQNNNFVQNLRTDFINTGDWERLTLCHKPVIAAVAGFALGGGCELAMMCDFILAADNAKFGQPEITLGTIPGAGGTQRLTRLVGKPKAMEMILTGRLMDATEAERAGLVARVVPATQLLDEARKVALTIASFSAPIVRLAKEAINLAYETTLSVGIHFERRMFHATFSTYDQKEGMSAFIDKRSPNFTDE